MPARVVIYLGCGVTPAARCGLPEALGARATPRRHSRARLCLALLPTGVAWPRRLPDAPVGSYPTFSPLPAPALAQAAGGLFLWPCPRGCPLPGVTRRRALWSADFPRRPEPPRPPGRPEAVHILAYWPFGCQPAFLKFRHELGHEVEPNQQRRLGLV